MENSIESIWKQGFLAEDALVAPKINALYQTKSKSVIAKLTRYQTIDKYTLYLMPGIAFAWFAYHKDFYAGAWISGMLFIMLVGLIQQLKAFKKVDNKQDTRTYLTQYLTTFKTYFKRIYFLVSVLVPFTLTGFFVIDGRESKWLPFINEYVEMNAIVYNFVHFLGMVLIFVTLTFVVEKVMYAPHISRLKEMVKDMDELKEEL